MLANLPTSLAGGLSGGKLNRMRTKRSNLVLVSSLLLVLTLMHLSLLNLRTKFVGGFDYLSGWSL